MANRTEGYSSINFKVQIFASDISETAILKAREGIYSHTEVQSLSEEVQNTYFSKINQQYKVKSVIRDSIVFARHNFVRDPPFPKVDLISCRNVFIYMDAFLQKKV